MRFGMFVTAILLCLLPGQALGATPAEKMRETYGAVQAMRADFTQVLTHKESGAEEKRAGVLEFKKPLLVRWETRTPSPELLVVGRKEIWNVFADEEIAYKYPVSLAEDSRSIIRVITGQASLAQDFDVEPAGVENGLAKLRIYPHEPTQSMTEGLLWVEDATGLIKRVVVVDFYGNTNDITLSNQEVSVDLPAGQFAYTPPAGFTVEDRSKDGDVTAKPLLQ